MMPLDRSAYPHIFQCILDSCDYPTLLILRATCKQVRDSIDTPRFKHIAVCRPQPRGKAIEIRKAVEPFERLPYLTWPDKPQWVPASSAGDADVAAASRARQLSHTTCVDFFGARQDLEPLMADLKNVQIIRRPKAMDSCLVAPTFVDFRDMTSKPAISALSMPWAAVGVRHGCKRLVLHLRYDAANPKMHNGKVRTATDEDVTDFELVWTPYPGTTPDEDHTPMFLGAPLGLFSRLPDLLFPQLVKGGKAVIAGVEKMHPTFFYFASDTGLHGQALVDEVAAVFEQKFRDWLGGDNWLGEEYDWTEEQIKAALPVFKTLEEWHAAAPPLERGPIQYPAPYCVDESILRPGHAPDEYYEEWPGREEYERNPEAYWIDGRLDIDAIDDMDLFEPDDEFDGYDDYDIYDDDDEYDPEIEFAGGHGGAFNLSALEHHLSIGQVPHWNYGENEFDEFDDDDYDDDDEFEGHGV